MKARPGIRARRRTARARGGAWLRRAPALLQAHWRDIFFVLLVAAGLLLYLARPERGAQWSAAQEWWGALLRYPGWEKSAARFEGEPLLRRPADYSQSELTALATFGDALEYLGADTAVTWGANGAAHRWLLTYWRCPATACDYRVRYTWGRSGPGLGLAVHDLARPAGHAGDYVVDHLLLPAAAARGTIAVQVESGGVWLPVSSPILQAEEGRRLFIWQK